MRKLLTAFFGTLVALAAYSQPKGPVAQRLLDAKMTVMQESLALSDTQMESFRPVYSRFEMELERVYSNSAKAQKGFDLSGDVTREMADVIVGARLDAAQRSTSVRRRFYPEFAAVLTPEQVIKFYQTENEIRNRINKEIKKRNL